MLPLHLLVHFIHLFMFMKYVKFQLSHSPQDDMISVFSDVYFRVSFRAIDMTESPAHTHSDDTGVAVVATRRVRRDFAV